MATTLPIPFRIRIGVTGHRTLNHEAGVRAAVSGVLKDRILTLFPAESRDLVAGLKDPPLCYRVVTALADGADQVVAAEIRQAVGALVSAVLPLDEDEYRTTISPAGLKAFDELLAADSNPRRLRRLPLAHEFFGASPALLDQKRNDAYDTASRYVVDHCDVLIAVWDGASRAAPAGGRSPGAGTRSTVEYARRRKRPVVVIDPNDPAQVTVEAGHGLSARAVPALKRFNEFELNAKFAETELRRVDGEVFEDHNPPAVLKPARQMVREELIPWYVRAEGLAKQNQRRFHLAGLLGYTLAALAVLFVAAAVLFPPYAAWLFRLEFAALFLILAVVLLTRKYRPQEKWIESRFLAERLRSAFYLASCGLVASPVVAPPYFGISHQADDWMVRAFDEIWTRLRVAGSIPSPYEPYRDFLKESWVAGQRKHHKRKADALHSVSRWLEGIGGVLFALAMAAAALHSFFGERLTRDYHSLESALTMIAIAFPAIGSALAGIRTHREHARLVRRSAQMTIVLEDLYDRFADARHAQELEGLIRETEELMLRESQEWLMMMRFAKIEPA